MADKFQYKGVWINKQYTAQINALMNKDYATFYKLIDFRISNETHLKSMSSVFSAWGGTGSHPKSLFAYVTWTPRCCVTELKGVYSERPLDHQWVASPKIAALIQEILDDPFIPSLVMGEQPEALGMLVAIAYYQQMFQETQMLSSPTPVSHHTRLVSITERPVSLS